MKAVTIFLAALLLAVPVFAAENEVRSANFIYKYDVASTSTTYCVAAGIGGDPFASPIAAQGQVETSGTSTTVSAVTAADAPFTEVAAGDILVVDKGAAGVDTVVVDTRTSATSVVVNEAVDWSNGYSFRYYDVTCGTAATNGWIPVSGWDRVQMTVQFDAGDVTKLSAVWECKEPAMGAGAVRVYPGISSDCGDGTLNGTVCEFDTVGQRLAIKVEHNAFGDCRLGVAYVTADGAVRDEITATLTVAR
jgi:hypothetical protein